MTFRILLKELNYAEFKVFIYCLTHNQERDHIGFGRWLGLDYSNAIKTWKRGKEGLEEKGYWVNGKWTKKAKDAINELEDEDFG